MSVQRYIILTFLAIRQNWLLTLHTILYLGRSSSSKS